MKFASFILTTAQSLIVFEVLAARAPFENKGRPFFSKKIEIVWAAPTNQLPASLQIFETESAKFSPAVISNLIKLGGFTEKDRTLTGSDGEKLPKYILAFRSQDESSSLTIAPSSGFAEIYNPNSTIFNTPLEKVPDQKRAYELGVALLKQLDIPTDQLIAKENGQLKAWFYPGTRGYFDNTKGQSVTEPNVMGVTFRRKVDGFDCFRQYVHMQFENQEQLTQLEIHWANLQPLRSLPVASADQIISWIREGRARVQSFAGPMDARWISLAEIKKLNIEEISLSYDAGNNEEKPSRYLIPYATLKCEAELGADDKETIWLFCPVIKEGLSRVSKKSDGFSIYPSKLNGRRRLAQEEAEKFPIR